MIGDERQTDLKKSINHDPDGVHDKAKENVNANVFEEMDDVEKVEQIRPRSKNPLKNLEFNEIDVVSANENLYYDM